MRRYTVRALTAELQTLIQGRYPAVEVEGEVGQIAVPGSGHAYLTLRDEDAVLGAVCWRDTWRRQKHQPKRGDRVVCRGRMGVYGGKGAYQLYVHDIQPAGAGRLAAEIAKRRARLEADGLLDPRRKRPLPSFPRCIGVATSLTGAALQDFLKVSGARFPAARVLVAGCQVQGERAPPSIVQAVDVLLEDGRAEVIVVTRGGGSKEDLLAFQDEGLARYLAACPVPVVSAVGHQIDTTLADLVADVVAPTPTAAAVAALPDGRALAQRVDDGWIALAAATARRLREGRQRIDALVARLRHPSDKLRDGRARVRDLEARARGAWTRHHQAATASWARVDLALPVAMGRVVAERRTRVERAVERAAALSPTRVLERGYAVVVGPHGVVQSTRAVAPGDAIAVRVADGTFDAEVVPPPNG